VLPPELTSVVERLGAHGVGTVRLESPVELPASVFRVDSALSAEREYQGHRLREVWGAWEDRQVTFAEGAVVVPVRQPLGRLIVLLLEPMSDDGFLAWNLLDQAMEESETYPIVRIHELPGSECSECAPFR